MTAKHIVESQLAKLGLKFKFFGRAEVRELANILSANESILHCTYGWYEGGKGILVATDSRLLLIDKRPFFLNLEDLRYEMLTEVDFSARLLDASMHLHTGMKKLSFRSVSDARLRKMCTYIQDQITQARRMEFGGQQMSEGSLMDTSGIGAVALRPHGSMLYRRRPTKFTMNKQSLI